MRATGPADWPGHDATYRTSGRTGTGTTGALPALQVSPAGAVLASSEPGPGQAAVAPNASRGGAPAARHERPWGSAGHRVKREAGRTPGRAGRGRATEGAPISGRPSGEEG